LVQTHPADVLALALPGAVYLGTLPVDVATEPQLVLDMLLHVRYQGDECAADVEAEAHPSRDIGLRLWEYGVRTSIVTRLPAISIVFWLEPDGAPPPSPYVRRAGDWVSTTWNYAGIEVYRLRAEPLFERGLVGLLPLVPFTQDGGDLSMVERAAEVIKERTAAPDLDILESLLAVFGARRFGNEAMARMIRRLFMSTEILETSPLYQEWARRATEQGLQQGLQQGLREAALEVLRTRFNPLPTEVAAALGTATVDVLRAVLAHATSDSLDEVRGRLGL